MRSSLLTIVCTVFLAPFLHAQTADITEGCPPLEIQFTAPGGASDFFWDFKDGATSNAENPTNTFTQPGIYEVDFREGPAGPLVGTVTITIFNEPELDIVADPRSGCRPLEVLFSDSSAIDSGINVLNYRWVFGDGEDADGPASQVNHTYNGAGTFTVSLSITTDKANCDATQIFPDFISVSDAPNVQFTTNPFPPAACEPQLQVSFNNNTTGGTGDLTYFWDFGNGQTSTAENPPAQNYTENGVFTVSLTATDQLGCSATQTLDVRIGNPMPVFSIPDTFCVDDTIDIVNQSAAGTYVWSITPGTFWISSTTHPNPRAVFKEKGFYDVTLTMTSPDGQCSGDTTITVFADQADASFAFDPIYTCEDTLRVNVSANSDEAVQHFWSTPAGNFSGKDTVITFSVTDPDSFAVYDPETFTILHTAVNLSGCTDTLLEEVEVRKPNARFMPDTIGGCAPFTAIFSDSSRSREEIIRWTWFWGDGTVEIFDTPGPYQHTFEEPGIYNVVLAIENELGCQDTSFGIQILVGDSIPVDFAFDPTEICPGDTVSFTSLSNSGDIDEWHFSSDGGRLSHCQDQSAVQWAFETETGTFPVNLTLGYNFCYSSSTASDSITVAGPIARLDYEVDCDNPFDLVFRDSSMEADAIVIDFGDGQSEVISPFDTLVHTYGDRGDYVVTLTATNSESGCEPSVDTQIVHIRQITAEINIDTIVCRGEEIQLDGSKSQDVQADCWRGYTWSFSFDRPITTQDSVINKIIGSQDTQQVILETIDINGCTAVDTVDIAIFSVMADFSSDLDSICFPRTANFTDLSTADKEIVSWEWDFGDGNMSTDQNPSHTFSTPVGGNSIVVTLTVTDEFNCPSTISKTFFINQPVAFAGVQPDPNLCEGETVTFVAGSTSDLDYAWDFGNGDMGTGTPAQATYEEKGFYRVTLTYTDPETGCMDQDTSIIINVQAAPDAFFTSSLDNEPDLCFPKQAFFMDQSTSDPTSPVVFWLWDFGNGQLAANPNPSTTFGKGTFEVQMIVGTSNLCLDTFTQTYTLTGPEGDFDLSADEICINDFITFTLQDTVDVGSYTWDFGDGTGVDNENPTSHRYTFYPPSGQTIATLILKDPSGTCETVIEKPVQFFQVFANFIRNDGIDTTVCQGASFPFINTSSGADSFEWDFGDGNTSTDENPSNTYPEPGSYTVTLAIENNTLGCQDTIEKVIVIDENPAPVISGDTLCMGSPAEIGIVDPNANSTYVWTPEELFFNNVGPNPITIPLEEEVVFNVQEIDPNGCIGTASQGVFIVPEFETTSFDTFTCPNEPAVLPVIKPDFYNFNWMPTDGLSCTNCSNPEAIIPGGLDSIVYSLQVTDVFGEGCTSESSEFTVRVITGAIRIPNAFTPNRDGTNDFFNVVIPEGLGESLQINTFNVFNRWGELVYENENPDQGWDGTQGGKESPMDVYVYVIEASLSGCSAVVLKGDVTLIR